MQILKYTFRFQSVASSAQHLIDIGKVIKDTAVVVISFGGSLPQYDPLITARESSSVDITKELMKRKLINEILKYQLSVTKTLIYALIEIVTKLKK